MIIPSLVLVLSGNNNLVIIIIAFILFIIFGLFLSMAQCRLAQTENIGHAINIQGAYDDLMTIGISKVVITIVVIALITGIISGIISAIFGILGNEILTAIVTSIVNIYMLFVNNRAIGLLYSDR